METTNTWIFIIIGLVILLFLLRHTIYINTSTVPPSTKPGQFIYYGDKYDSTQPKPPCSKTTFGCCPDGIRSKANSLGSNCPASYPTPYTVGPILTPNQATLQHASNSAPTPTPATTPASGQPTAGQVSSTPKSTPNLTPSQIPATSTSTLYPPKALSPPRNPYNIP